jgi:hypothetical protein
MSERRVGILTAVGRAFTLVELFLVMAILAIAITLGVPTFSAMIEGTNRTLAENSLREGVRQARDLASASPQDAAAVFLFDPGGRLRIVPMVKVGVLDELPGDPFQDIDPNLGGLLAQQGVQRDVFAPVPGLSGIELPEGWMVRGYVPGGRMGPVNPSIENDPDWYDSELYDFNTLSAGNAKSEGNWVAPESGYYNPYSAGGRVAVAGGFSTARQSFMVRFEAGTGLLRRDAAPAIAIDPRPSTANPVEVSDQTLRIDRAENLQVWARAVLAAPPTDLIGSQDDNRANRVRGRLIGKYSNDTVLAGVVTRLAVYKVEELADGLGARGVNAETGTLYEAPAKQEDIRRGTTFDGQVPVRMDVYPQDRSSGQTFPDGVLTPWRNDLNALRVSINQWIEGDVNQRRTPGWRAGDAVGDGDYDDDEDGTSAVVYLVDTLSGELISARRAAPEEVQQ